MAEKQKRLSVPITNAEEAFLGKIALDL